MDSHTDCFFSPERDLGRFAEALGIHDWDKSSLNGFKNFVCSREVNVQAGELILNCIHRYFSDFEAVKELDIIEEASCYFKYLPSGINQIHAATLHKQMMGELQPGWAAEWHIASSIARILEVGELLERWDYEHMAWFPQRMEHKVILGYAALLFVLSQWNLAPVRLHFYQALEQLKYWFQCRKCGKDWKELCLTEEEAKWPTQVCTRCPTLESGEMVEFEHALSVEDEANNFLESLAMELDKK